MSWTIRHGDCLELLPELEPESVDSCVTDPPYGLAFMGRGWDSPDNVAFRPETWQLVLRALKPGAHLLAFGGTRTFHRLTCAIEDAGFEVRDVLCWLYGQGMPKSHDVSKAIDKAAGAEREVVGAVARPAGNGPAGAPALGGGWQEAPMVTAPATPAAKQWDGWGTALSPSWEPIVLARKPLSGTVAANVLEHGTGALNIDGCRLPTSDDLNGGAYAKTDRRNEFFRGLDAGAGEYQQPAGRWPPNVALDEEAAAAVDRQSGERPGGGSIRQSGPIDYKHGQVYGFTTIAKPGRGDSGGASRFFYCPKASTSERNAGLGDEQNPHPTVKPIALMRWLCRLVTPPGGMVLDPFCGSGSTGIAAVLEGFRFLGLEQDAEAVRVAGLRIHHRQPNADELASVEPARAKQGRLF